MNQPPTDCRRPRYHILRLANETLHQICQELSGNYDALSGLRLSCRALQVIPEQYLFTTIHLNRRSSSLENLQVISKHERLRHHVTDIRLELDMSLPGLTRHEWNTMTSAYQRGLHPRQVVQPRVGVYGGRELLAVEKSAMTAESKERAYCEYVAIRAEQRDLQKHYSPAILAEIFATSFHLLPNLHRLNHGVYDPSQLHSPDSVALKRSEREPLTLASSASDWTSAD